MKRFFDILFYLLIIFACYQLYTGEYLEKIIHVVNKVEKQEKENKFYRNKIRKMNNKINSLENQLNNVELYIYKEKQKEN